MNIVVEKITDGLGFGYGKISKDEIEAEAGPKVASLMDQALQAPELLVPIDEDEPGHVVEDDGCGDGRPVETVFRKVSGTMQSLSRSLHRSKVFGGGAAMAVATLIGMGRATGQRLQDTFVSGIELLKERRIDYGAHTADVKDPAKDSGCGAIDHAPDIVVAAGTYRGQIKGTLELLKVDMTDFDAVMANFAATARANEGQAYSGKAVMDAIADNGKIVKKLLGGHLETRIVLNFVKGYTVNQELIRERTGGKADVFAVDVWRVQELAEKLYPDDRLAQHRAIMSELVYTLATAAVLSKGDLPVYTVTEATAD